MANFYKGEEIRFSLNIEAQGFSMDDDDFDVKVSSSRGNTTLVGTKTGTVTEAGSSDVVIFKEDGTWWCIVNTQDLEAGDLIVQTTAYVKDTHANDGVRTTIARESLGRLVN